MSATVSLLDSVRVVYRVLLRQLLTRGRVIALVVIGAVVVLLGWLVGRAEPAEQFPPQTAAEIALEELEAGVFVVSLIGFTLLVPIVALVFAGASLGDTREDGTLVYLWLRPMPRAGIAVGAWLAAITVSLPLTLIPMTLTAVSLDAGSDLVVASALATVVGILAYSALFVLLGLTVKNSIVWGLGYILIWEGLVASFGSAAAKVAVRGYLSSILTDRTGVDIALGDLSQTTGVVVPLVVAVVALLLATYRLNNLEVA
jgi:ABC-2 type transport system permease protein